MFRIFRAATVAAACAWGAIAAAQSAAPTLLASAVAATQAGKADYAFDLEIDTNRQNSRTALGQAFNERSVQRTRNLAAP